MSNGFVALAPYRSEFYGTGLQNHNIIGTLNWLDVLSLHEYRHALQYVNGNRGLTKFLSYFQGQAGWSLGYNFAVPAWYAEGDAVVAETVLSKAGRGRMPAFYRNLRANLLNGKDYSYMTAENGSLLHMIPDHYKLGYTMNNYVRNKYGADVMKKVLADAGAYKGIIYPFSHAMKKYTGHSTKKMYKLAYADLKKQWEEELKNTKLIPTQTITPKPKRTVTNYNYPQILSDGSIVAIKGSYDEIKKLVHIKNGKEKKLCVYGTTPFPFLSEKNGKLAWTELQSDPRRANRNYTRVVLYDMNTQEKTYITEKSKYFSPEYSAKGDKIIVVRADKKLKNNLVIIDGTNGEVIAELPNKNNDFLSVPKWTNNDKAIVYLAKRNSQLAILKYDLDSKTTTELTKWTATNIGNIDVVDNKVYYSAGYSGIDNIYSVNTNGDQKISKISSVRIGAYEPVVSKNQKELVMVEYTDMGTLLTKMDLSKNKAEENFSYVEPIEMKRYNVVTNENEHNIFDKIPSKTYKVKPYKGFFKGMKLHSWQIGATGRNPQATLMIDNILTDFKAQLGAMYNTNEKGFNYFGDIIYSKYFVEVGLNAKYLNRSVDYFAKPDSLAGQKFKEQNYGATLGIPLSWNKGSFNFTFKPTAGFTYHKTSKYEKPATLKGLDFGSVTSSVSFSALQSQAKQNLMPRWGIDLNAQHQKSISKEVDAERINVAGNVYIPALMRNHGIKIGGNWQKELTTNNFRFVDYFDYARGYQASPNDEIYKMSVDYSLPLLYPDWGFNGIAYFKRVRTNLFYDMSKVKYLGKTTDQNSYGAELYFDTSLMNIIPLSVGFRQSFLLNKDVLNADAKNRFEVVLKMGF